MDDRRGNIRTKKALLRKEMLKNRRALSFDEQRSASQKICEKFLESDEYKDAKTILLYKAYNNEVDTDLIFERAEADGKTVAYPLSKISEGEPDLLFYVVHDLSELTEGYMNIPEPNVRLMPTEFTGSADVCIAPGVAFDSKCHRIGYGNAFYDRYLRLNSPKRVIALAFDVQIADDFETEESDRAVDMVITQSTVYKNE